MRIKAGITVKGLYLFLEPYGERPTRTDNSFQLSLSGGEMAPGANLTVMSLLDWFHQRNGLFSLVAPGRSEILLSICQRHYSVHFASED